MKKSTASVILILLSIGVLMAQPTFKNEKKKVDNTNMGKPKLFNEAPKECYFKGVSSSFNITAVQSDEGGNAQLTVYTKLEGISEEMVQEFTDKAKDLLEAKLQSQGYTVSAKDWSAVQDLKQWKKKVDGAKSEEDKPYISNGGAWTLIPKRQAHTINASATGVQVPMIPNSIVNQVDSWVMMAAMKDPKKYGENRIAITMNITNNYGSFKSGLMAGGIGQAAVNFNQELTTNITMSINYTSPKSKFGGFLMSTNLTYGNNDWGNTAEAKDDISIDLSALGGSAVKRAFYATTIDPEKYKAAVMENIEAGIDALVEQFMTNLSEL